MKACLYLTGGAATAPKDEIGATPPWPSRPWRRSIILISLQSIAGNLMTLSSRRTDSSRRTETTTSEIDRPPTAEELAALARFRSALRRFLACSEQAAADLRFDDAMAPRAACRQNLSRRRSHQRWRACRATHDTRPQRGRACLALGASQAGQAKNRPFQPSPLAGCGDAVRGPLPYAISGGASGEVERKQRRVFEPVQFYGRIERRQPIQRRDAIKAHDRSSRAIRCAASRRLRPRTLEYLEQIQSRRPRRRRTPQTRLPAM